MSWSSSQAMYAGVEGRSRRDVFGLFARLEAPGLRGIRDGDVAAGRALVGHETADEGDLLAVGGEAGDGDLKAVEWAGDVVVSRRSWMIPTGEGLGPISVVALRTGSSVLVTASSKNLLVELGDPPVVFAWGSAAM